MRRAVRAVSVERGRDPRHHTLVAFGGAGGIHAAALAAEMEMNEVAVPVAAGLFSSLGLLFADTAVSRLAAIRRELNGGASSVIDAHAERLAGEAIEELKSLHPGDASPELEIRVNLRYIGQSSTLMLPYEPGTDIADLAGAFHAEHRRAYGQSAEAEAVETTAVRVRASWPAPALSFADLARQELANGAARNGWQATRTLYFGPAAGSREAPIIDRSALAGGVRAGPLVIEEAEATILVPPGATASLDATGSVILRVGAR
jgi:N-methylhydantoinase A